MYLDPPLLFGRVVADTGDQELLTGYYAVPALPSCRASGYVPLKTRVRWRLGENEVQKSVMDTAAVWPLIEQATLSAWRRLSDLDRRSQGGSGRSPSEWADAAAAYIDLGRLDLAEAAVRNLARGTLLERFGEFRNPQVRRRLIDHFRRLDWLVREDPALTRALDVLGR
ncbi:hypothetical protein [Actinospica robiniae]|uniref:hypothetical protein n=1 Tax=Actinospica robiniae TaxID=304901 RepID=UPI0012F91CAD|nr:hypothetical protein [Actinospica robiniae]